MLFILGKIEIVHFFVLLYALYANNLYIFFEKKCLYFRASPIMNFIRRYFVDPI
jgi:hypothetical protein